MDWEQLEKQYKFQPALTKKLDALTGDFTQETINEIVLWKVNRYAELDKTILDRLNQIPREKDYRPTDAEIKELVEMLLKRKGIRLAMASSILRFRNPYAFQVIDQRVFRCLYPESAGLPDNADADTYIAYLRSLRKFCVAKDIDFFLADRLLYEADKIENKGKPLKGYGAKKKAGGS